MKSLKPQDVAVVLKLCVDAGRRDPEESGMLPRSMAVLGIEVGLSSSEVHAAIRRSRASGLLRPDFSGRDAPNVVNPARADLDPRSRVGSRQRPNGTAVLEFLVPGPKCVFPAKRGELTRGVPTSCAVPPLSALVAERHAAMLDQHGRADHESVLLGGVG